MRQPGQCVGYRPRGLAAAVPCDGNMAANGRGGAAWHQQDGPAGVEHRILGNRGQQARHIGLRRGRCRQDKIGETSFVGQRPAGFRGDNDVPRGNAGRHLPDQRVECLPVIVCQIPHMAGGGRGVLPGVLSGPAEGFQLRARCRQADYAAMGLRCKACGRFNARRPCRIFAEVDQDGPEVHDEAPSFGLSFQRKTGVAAMVDIPSPTGQSR
ncbi:protein of unknown function [Cupriavidus taiwanensis]|nr:protein of unknown function [Cupriavidus taiwanensis]